MSKAKLAAARELIEEKKYVEARALLLTIKDDPTAAKWLAKLEERIKPAAGSTPALTAQNPTARRPYQGLDFSPPPPPKQSGAAQNFTVLPDDNVRMANHPLNRPYPEPVPRDIPQVESMGTAKLFRTIWGVLTLLSLGWICYGITATSNVLGTQLNSASARASNAYQAGTLIGGGLGLTAFLCTGGPFLLVFGILYWRNGVAIRETKKHNQMVEALSRR